MDSKFNIRRADGSYDTDKILGVIASFPPSWYEENYSDDQGIGQWYRSKSVNDEEINGFHIGLSPNEIRVATGGYGKKASEIVMELVVRPLLAGYNKEWFANKCAWVMWDCEDDYEAGETEEDWCKSIAGIMVHYAVVDACRLWSMTIECLYGNGVGQHWYRSYYTMDDEFMKKAKSRADEYGSTEYVPERIEEAIASSHWNEQMRASSSV